MILVYGLIMVIMCVMKFMVLKDIKGMVCKRKFRILMGWFRRIYKDFMFDLSFEGNVGRKVLDGMFSVGGVWV